MKHMYPTVMLTGLLTLALGLSACSSMGSDSSGSTGIGSSGASGSSGSSGSSGASGMSGSGDGPGSTGGRNLDTSTPPGSASTGTGTTLDPSARTGQMLDQSGAMGASGASGSTGWSDEQAQGSQRSGMPAAANATPNGTVVSIEPLASNERSASGSGSGSASGSESGSSSGSAGSSSGGATGSGGAGQAYRVTLRMDDGSTQVITQAGTPAFRSGDRVNLGSGVISR